MTSEHDRWARAIGQWSRLAAELLDRCRRSDLAQYSRSLGRRVDGDVVRVLVTGDFKQGKSSLVNAIVGGDVCSCDVTVPTSVPTVCWAGPDPAARVIERREDAIRRGVVTQLEARAAQNGTWPNAVTVELEVSSGPLGTGLEIVDCPPASNRSASRAATVEAAMAADVVLVVSDAAQALTEPEVGLLTDLCATVTTILVVTKCDLVPHWRAVVDENWTTLERLGLPCEVVPVAARIHPPGDGPRDPASADSGIDGLVEQLRRGADRERRVALLTEATDGLASALDEARAGLRRDLTAYGDGARLRERVQEAEIDLHRCESLRSPSATWHRLLDARCEEILMELHDRAEDGLHEVETMAASTLDDVDPAKDWDTFEPWLRNAASTVANDVISAAERRVALVAREVTQAFADSRPHALAGFGRSLPETRAPSISVGSASEARFARIVREGFATLGSTSAGLLAFATLGGVISAAVLAPVTVVIGAGLGGTAIAADRRNERTGRRQRAVDAVERYLATVQGDVDETLAAGLADFRTRASDQLIARAEELVTTARQDLLSAQKALEDADAARERLAQTDRSIAEIDELLERIRRPVSSGGHAP